MNIEQLDPLTAQARLSEGWIMVDVREESERAQHLIPGTQFLPLSVLTQRAEELPEGPLILQCAAGMRSQQAAQFLASQGRTVANLSGGIQGWYRMGLPIE